MCQLLGVGDTVVLKTDRVCSCAVCTVDGDKKEQAG